MKKSHLKKLIKHILKEVKESTEPSIGGSYGDQQTYLSAKDYVKPAHDPLTDPLLTGKNMNESRHNVDEEKMKEFKDVIFRASNPWPHIYDWVKHGTINSDELAYLAAQLSDPMDY